MADPGSPLRDTTISGPEKVTFTLRSGRGPLSRSGALRLPPKQIAFVNTGTGTVDLALVSIDPAYDERRGVTATASNLQVDVAGPLLVAVGKPLIVTVTGTIPAQPGTYVSAVRVHPGAGSPITVPLSITVAASPAWGVGLTILGLSVVNLMAGLDTQGDIAAKLREALHKRGDAQIFVAQYPEPEGRGDVPAMRRAYDAAIAALSRPRSAGLLDHRLEDAAAPLAEADGLVTSLRIAAAKLSPADALIATAEIPWKVLQPQLQALAAPVSAAPDSVSRLGAGNADGGAFGSGLDAMLGRLRDRLVGAPARWLEAELAAQVTRLKLTTAAGEIEEARAQARMMQIAIRRAAHSLAVGQRLVMRQGAQMAFLLGNVADIQHGLADPDIPAPARADIETRLSAAQALLSEGAELRRLVDVGRGVNAAETALALAASHAEANRVAVAVAAASAETDFPEVDQAVAAAQADPDKSPASKTAHLKAIVAAWRATIGRAVDPAARPALLTRLDTVEAALERGDMPGVRSSYRELTTAWATYGTQRAVTAGAHALKPYCDEYAARLQRRLGFVDQDLQWEESNARRMEWDRRRDRLRLALQRVAPDADCLQAMLAVDKDAIGLTSEIGAASADTAGIDAAVRLEAMAVYGLSASTGPRTLVPYTDTPASELLVDRPMKISVANLDPAWGVGTTVSIGFGDGTPVLSIDAETLRQTAAEHTYTRPLSAQITALATDGVTSDGHAVGVTLGDGTATLLIAPPPDSRARLLADRFFSARFALALIVALVIYSWRFQARDRVFGARGFDYAEAFILGFAVNAAIADLPGILAKLPT